MRQRRERLNEISNLSLILAPEKERGKKGPRLKAQQGCQGVPQPKLAVSGGCFSQAGTCLSSSACSVIDWQQPVGSMATRQAGAGFQGQRLGVLVTLLIVGGLSGVFLWPPHQQWHRGQKLWVVLSRVKLPYRADGLGYVDRNRTRFNQRICHLLTLRHWASYLIS